MSQYIILEGKKREGPGLGMCAEPEEIRVASQAPPSRNVDERRLEGSPRRVRDTVDYRSGPVWRGRGDGAERLKSGVWRRQREGARPQGQLLALTHTAAGGSFLRGRVKWESPPGAPRDRE